MNSIWSNTTSLPPHPSLNGSVNTDAAIIGGGLAGILTAYFLKQRGLNPVILEAARTAGGQTKNTTAKITVQHGAIYQKLIKSFGLKDCSLYYRAQQDALDQYARLTAELSVSCGFTRLPSYLYTTRSPRLLQKEADAAAKIGIPSELTRNTSLPFPAFALRYPEQAQFHPLEFINALAKDIAIYENTRVISLRETSSGTILTVPKGTVCAKYVVFACHYPFINLPGLYFMKMHQERSYVLALENAGLPDGMYYGVDPDGLSFRSCGPYLLLGGGAHRTGEPQTGPLQNGPQRTNERRTGPDGRKRGGPEASGLSSYEKLALAAREYYPDSRIVCRWSAQDCMTHDNLPYIGRFSGTSPNWFIASGFRKWGMTNSMVSAGLLSDLITGKSNPYEKLFSPSRFTPAASAGSFLKDSGKAVKTLAKELFSVPRDKLEDIPIGGAGIISWNGEKTGVYKNTDGHVYAVSVRCPHLGCELCWNQDELSWDCPCHGSRFDYTGKRIDNPAEADLPAYQINVPQVSTKSVI